jgi:hypothetical protein
VRRAINIGTVSWINREPNPMSLALEALLYTPDWVPKTYLGLAATSNPDPGEKIDNFNDFRGSRDFRALTYCNVDIETNDTTGAVTKFQVSQSFYDPGFTPPFSQLHWPSTFLKPDPAIWSFTWYPGEAAHCRRSARKGATPTPRSPGCLPPRPCFLRHRSRTDADLPRTQRRRLGSRTAASTGRRCWPNNSCGQAPQHGRCNRCDHGLTCTSVPVDGLRNAGRVAGAGSSRTAAGKPRKLLCRNARPQRADMRRADLHHIARLEEAFRCELAIGQPWT